MISDQFIYFITVNSIETEQTMEAINNDFHNIGGMLDKVSKKLTDKQYKDMYDKLGQLKTMVENMSETKTGKFIKICYEYRYVKYWYDHEQEEIQSDIETYYYIHKIFKIIDDDDDATHSNQLRKKNIEVMLSTEGHNTELDKIFVDAYIINSSKIDFAFEEEPDDDYLDDGRGHKFGTIKLHDFYLY